MTTLEILDALEAGILALHASNGHRAPRAATGITRASLRSRIARTGLSASEFAQAARRLHVGNDLARGVAGLVIEARDVDRIADHGGDGDAECFGYGEQFLVGDALGAAFQARNMRLAEANELAQGRLGQALALAQFLQVRGQFIHMSNIRNPT